MRLTRLRRGVLAQLGQPDVHAERHRRAAAIADAVYLRLEAVLIGGELRGDDHADVVVEDHHRDDVLRVHVVDHQLDGLLDGLELRPLHRAGVIEHERQIQRHARLDRRVVGARLHQNIDHLGAAGRLHAFPTHLANQ